MPYEIHFDIAAAIIFLVLIYTFFTYKHFPTWHTKLFFILLLDSLITVILNTTTCFSDLWPQKYIFWKYLLCILHLLTTNSVAPLYYVYIFSLTHEKKDLSKKDWVPIAACSLFEFYAIVSTPYTHFVVYYTDAGNYCYGFGMTLLYIASLVYLILGFYQILHNKRKLDAGKISIVVFYTLATITATIIQFFNPLIQLIAFSIALSELLTYITLQNPLEFEDSINGMYNRHALEEILSERINSNKYCSLIILKPDEKSSLHAQFTMENGTFILKQFSSKLKPLCGHNRIFYLYEDCFAILSDNERDNKKRIASLIDFTRHPFIATTQNEQFSFSKKTRAPKIEFPVSLYLYVYRNPQKWNYFVDKNEHVETNTLINIIRYAVSEYKGRDTNVFHSINQILIDEYQNKLLVEKAMQQAIQKESFEIFFQPIYDVHKKSFTKAEALLRLKDSDGSYIPPSIFIPAAEKNGDILKIRDISLKKVCQFITDYSLFDLGISTININLSMLQLLQNGIANHLLSILNEYKIPKEKISFEITELMYSQDEKRANEIMESLEKENIHFSLDSYGTGYSNTASIMHHQYAEIKLDRSLIIDAEKDKTNLISLKHLINMIKEEGITVLAEGIEKKETASILESLGCDLMQGFYYAHPMPEEQFIAFLKEKA